MDWQFWHWVSVTPALWPQQLCLRGKQTGALAQGSCGTARGGSGRRGTLQQGPWKEAKPSKALFSVRTVRQDLFRDNIFPRCDSSGRRCKNCWSKALLRGSLPNQEENLGRVPEFLLLFTNILVVTLLGQSTSAAWRYLIRTARGQLMEEIFVVQMVPQRFCLHRKGCTGLDLTKKTNKQ